MPRLTPDPDISTLEPPAMLRPLLLLLTAAVDPFGGLIAFPVPKLTLFPLIPTFDFPDTEIPLLLLPLTMGVGRTVVGTPDGGNVPGAVVGTVDADEVWLWGAAGDTVGADKVWFWGVTAAIGDTVGADEVWFWGAAVVGDTVEDLFWGAAVVGDTVDAFEVWETADVGETVDGVEVVWPCGAAVVAATVATLDIVWPCGNAVVGVTDDVVCVWGTKVVAVVVEIYASVSGTGVGAGRGLWWWWWWRCGCCRGGNGLGGEGLGGYIFPDGWWGGGGGGGLESKLLSGPKIHSTLFGLNHKFPKS